MALIALMMELDLDMLICARTCPYQSWQNIAERIMSTLNLALMNVSLCRTQLPDGHEEAVHSKTTLTDLRKLISEKPPLKMLVRDSVQQALCTLQSRIACMEIKGERIGIAEPSSDEDIEKTFQRVLFIEPNLERDNLTKKSTADATSLHHFMEKHCFQSAYLF